MSAANGRAGQEPAPSTSRDRFEPYVSLNDNREDQCRKMNQWLQHSPFPPALRHELGSERGGAARNADLVEHIASRRPRRVLNRWCRLRPA
jgi:hypothetical protein